MLVTAIGAGVDLEIHRWVSAVIWIAQPEEGMRRGSHAVPFLE